MSSYSATEPLHLHLAAYARQYRLGSGDRRSLYRLIYTFFRLGKALPEADELTRLAVALFLCETNADRLSTALFEQHGGFKAEYSSLPLEQKLEITAARYASFRLEDIFPFSAFLSKEIDAAAFQKSFFEQPLVFIRIRKGFETVVKEELSLKAIPYSEYLENPNTLGFQNGTDLQNLDSFKKALFEIQDISSQRVGVYYNPKAGEYWWDCCAGAGGKSLLLLDKEQSIHLSVSDVRENIIENLLQRFKKAGLQAPQHFIADLSKAGGSESLQKSFDAIIADVPCSGSGTWGRSPEWLTYFKPEQLKYYTETQFRIVASAARQLKEGGCLIYSTCSVFSAENENLVQRIENELALKADSSTYTKGYGMRADTLFAARFSRK